MSASEGFLSRGFKILNFSLKVLIKIGSFMRVSTVVSNYSYLKESFVTAALVSLAACEKTGCMTSK